MLDGSAGGPGRSRRSAQRNHAWAICLLILALGALPLTIGCGSDGKSKATEHYANAKYGFSFDYPPSVVVAEKLRRARGSAWEEVLLTCGRQAREFGLFLCDSEANPKGLRDNFLLMLVSSADHEPTDAEARAAQKARLSELQKKAANPQWGIDILDSSIITAGGVSALNMIYDYDLRPESQRTVRVWDRFLVKGRYTYVLEYVGLDEDFDHDVQRFASVMESFTIE